MECVDINHFRLGHKCPVRFFLCCLLPPLPVWMEQYPEVLETLDGRIRNHCHHLDEDLPELSDSQWTLDEQETNFSCFKTLIGGMGIVVTAV